MLKPIAYKMDLFRYLYLYRFGGIYMDFKMMLNCSLYKIIEQCSDVLTLCSDQLDGDIYIIYRHEDK